MNIEDFRVFCLSQHSTYEDFPFDETTLVFKVGGKMFALTDLAEPFSITLKCNPERALSLREHYPSIQPAWHFNKKHWINILCDGSVSDDMLKELIMHSYQLVVESLPRKLKPTL
ncbi:MAG: MmcQ/YjbR family DNA-binding protein [Bacteroidales bacterium]